MPQHGQLRVVTHLLQAFGHVDGRNAGAAGSFQQVQLRGHQLCEKVVGIAAATQRVHNGLHLPFLPRVRSQATEVSAGHAVERHAVARHVLLHRLGRAQQRQQVPHGALLKGLHHAGHRLDGLRALWLHSVLLLQLFDQFPRLLHLRRALRHADHARQVALSLLLLQTPALDGLLCMLLREGRLPEETKLAAVCKVDEAIQQSHKSKVCLQAVLVVQIHSLSLLWLALLYLEQLRLDAPWLGRKIDVALTRGHARGSVQTHNFYRRQGGMQAAARMACSISCGP